MVSKTFEDIESLHFSRNEMLFKVVGVLLVDNYMGGYNSCMFAYDQIFREVLVGTVLTVVRHLESVSTYSPDSKRVFTGQRRSSRGNTKDKDARREKKLGFTCKCSFLKIYNEQILDPLGPSSVNLQVVSNQDLGYIREDNKKGIYAENITKIDVPG
ncbi:hypothetical protein OROHE_003489 [Orobanche hederae]